MEIDSEKLLEQSIRTAFCEGVKERLRYNKPIDNLLDSSIGKYSGQLRSILEDAIGSCVNDDTFRQEIAGAVRSSLAKTLIQRFGGEIERQANALKSDPITRARITMAIEEIARSKT